MNRICAAAMMVLSLSSPARAQTLAIADENGKEAWKAAQGQKLTLTTAGLTCDRSKKEPTITFDQVNIEADAARGPNTWVSTVPPSLPPGAYKVTVTCGTAKPAAWLKVTPSIAEVVCAFNVAPKPTEERPSPETCSPTSIWEVRVGDRVDMEVFQLDDLRKGNGNKPLRLFIGGIELKNLDVHLSTIDAETSRSTLWTRLDFDNDNADNRKAWVQLMQMARNSSTLDVSVGPEGGPAFASTATVHFNAYSTGWLIFTVLFIAVLLAGTVVLTAKSSLLRGPACAVGKAPFSLARHQMAAWFVVVISAFLFLMLMTGRAATSSTALILIGISGATGLAAVAIDAQQAGQVVRDRNALLAEQTAITSALNDPASGLTAQLAKVASGSPEAAQLTASIQAKTQRLAEIAGILATPVAGPSPSKGWLRDLLSDENGVSFHRLQIIGWTIVLVGVFLRAVWHDLAMPDFDTTTLALLGVSSGTYLGFKLPK